MNNPYLNISAFNDLKDNKVSPVETDWVYILKIFSALQVFDNKTDVPLFNSWNYNPPDTIENNELITTDDHGREFTLRRKESLLSNSMIVVDVDNELADTVNCDCHRSIDDAKNWFSDYEFLLLTTHSHRSNKHRFRILLPLATAMSLENWESRKSAIKAFVGDCDISCLNAGHIFYVHSAPSKYENDAVAYHNQGSLVDWRTFKADDALNTDQSITTYESTHTINAKNPVSTLSPDYVFETQKGAVRFGDVTDKVSGVICPYHTDQNGSEFIRHNPKNNNTFFRCGKCELTIWMADEVSKPNQEVDFEKHTANDFVDASDRSIVNSELKKIGEDIINTHHLLEPDSKPESHVLLFPEGAGKSQLARSLVENNIPVLFVCKSWDQTIEKYISFTKQLVGSEHNTYLLKSLSAFVKKRFGAQAHYKSSDNPYNLGQLDVDKTIEAIKSTGENASEAFLRLSLNLFRQDDFDFTNPEKNQFVFSTIEMLRSASFQGKFLPKEWIVWVDDPEFSDLIDIHPVTSRRVSSDSDSITIIQGQTYYKRHENLSLGAKLQNNICIYTTTEKLNERALKSLFESRDQPYKVHDGMHHLAGGQVTIVGTSAVRRNLDGLLPVYMQRLKKDGFDLTFIADGLAVQHNHVVTKGKNNLSDKNSIIEISVPHPNQVQTTCHALGLPYGPKSNEIARIIALDKMHQAIGRNCGYRSQSNEATVLVDKNYLKCLVESCRYELDTVNCVIIDKTKKMGRLETKFSNNASLMLKRLDKLINHPDQYLMDHRKVKSDIALVLGQVSDADKLTRYIARLLTALTTISGVNFENNTSSVKQNERTAKYQKLGGWITSKWKSSMDVKLMWKHYNELKKQQK